MQIPKGVRWVSVAELGAQGDRVTGDLNVTAGTGLQRPDGEGVPQVVDARSWSEDHQCSVSAHWIINS